MYEVHSDSECLFKMKIVAESGNGDNVHHNFYFEYSLYSKIPK